MTIKDLRELIENMSDDDKVAIVSVVDENDEYLSEVADMTVDEINGKKVLYLVPKNISC